MIFWSMQEILDARYALATVFKWKRETNEGFDVVYGLQTTDYAGITSDHIMVSRQFCDKFHNPRHLPVLASKAKYVHSDHKHIPSAWVVYELNKYFSNGYASYLPVKWWDKAEEKVEHFSAHYYALDRIDQLRDCGIAAECRWLDSESVWEVYYNA